jgi:hypothetical protein
MNLFPAIIINGNLCSGHLNLLSPFSSLFKYWVYVCIESGQRKEIFWWHPNGFRLNLFGGKYYLKKTVDKG